MDMNKHQACRAKWAKALRVFFALTGFSPDVNHISFMCNHVYIEWNSSNWIQISYPMLKDYDSLKNGHEEIVITESFA